MLAKFIRLALAAVIGAAWAHTCLAQQTSKVTLDVDESLFSVTAAINNCGYDYGLKDSDPVRSQVRDDLAKALAASPRAQDASHELCAFYRDHQQPDPSLDLAQYISLALNLSEPPGFALKVKEADLPPDASYVLGFLPLLRNFYKAADLHQAWLHHEDDYNNLIEHFHDPVTNLLLSTDVYLRMPISGYLGRRFVIYLEPLSAPGQINARNYISDYYLVTAPDEGKLNLDQIRHTYLHFVLDPMVLKMGTTMKRLQPLLKSVATAPMDESFKRDITLLVTESLIRAVEARTQHPGKAGEAAGARSADAAVAEGFILARYFYDNLVAFESAPTGLQDAFPDWLYALDVDHQRKLSDQVVFASKASPEVLRGSGSRSSSLDLAEQRIASGDYSGAQKLAQQALDSQQGDPGRALFILAQVAVFSRDIDGARDYFERSLQVAKDNRVLAWDHIYLGRILDVQDERETALVHYRAALQVTDTSPDIKAAAERGLKEPYELKKPSQ